MISNNLPEGLVLLQWIALFCHKTFAYVYLSKATHIKRLHRALRMRDQCVFDIIKIAIYDYMPRSNKLIAH